MTRHSISIYDRSEKIAAQLIACILITYGIALTGLWFGAYVA